jgi:tetratricopeptide (TPR) repeat protein
MNMSVRTKILAAFIAACLSVPPGMAFAGPEEAAQYYEQASKAYEEGELAKAADLLERAYAEDPNLIYQYNRVLALQAMGKNDQALKILDIYGNPMREDGRFDDVKEIRSQIEKAKAEADAAAKKNAETKTATNDDKIGDEIGEGGDGEAKIAEPVDSGPNILGWSLVGVGVAGLSAAGLFGSGVLISDVVDRRDCMSPAGTPLNDCYSDFDDAVAQNKSDRDTLSTHQTLTWVSLGVGVAALIGGGAVMLMDGQAGAEADAPVSADKAEVHLSPFVSADGAGGVLRILF